MRILIKIKRLKKKLNGKNYKHSFFLSAMFDLRELPVNRLNTNPLNRNSDHKVPLFSVKKTHMLANFIIYK